MRLIDADDLINELTSFCEKQEDPKDKDIVTTVSLFVEIYARTTPPIDISVVRCKDCRHWWMPYGTDNTRGVCQLLDLNTDDDFFCKNGER